MITLKGRKIMKFIAGYIREHGESPFIREIAEATGVKDPSDEICRLRAEGFLGGKDRKRRGLRILRTPSGNSP